MDLLLINDTLIINNFPVPTALLFGSRGRGGVETNSAVQVCFLYFGVESIEKILTLDMEHGGAVLYPKKSNGDLSSVAEIQDTEGNRIALHEETKKK
jgi:predicted enzyme related to lactoylglutathione lyase